MRIHYQRGIMLIFIIGAILPDIAWCVYVLDYWGIFPPAPPYIIPFAQFFHGLWGQLVIWMWIALALSIARLATYENVLAAGMAGSILHHIIDLATHSEGQYPLYPYVQQDWSVGWFLDHSGGIFNELSLFGLLLLILFGIMFTLIVISYRTIDIFEGASRRDLAVGTGIITVFLFSYWLGIEITISVALLILIAWMASRFLTR